MNYLKKFCPICAIVSATWIILLALRYGGYQINESLVALLMGGSAVGLSYVLAKRLPSSRDKRWKFSAIPLAFLCAWLLLHYRFFAFALAAVSYGLLFLVFKGQALGPAPLAPRSSESEVGKTKQIEHELENCC